MINKSPPKARWGYSPPGFKSQLLFTPEKTKELAAICGRDDGGDVTRLSELLNDEASALQFVRYVYEADVSAPEQRAALRELAKGARRLVLRLEEADPNTRRAIYSAYPNVQPADEQDTPPDRNGRSRRPTSRSRARMAPLPLPARSGAERQQVSPGQPSTTPAWPTPSRQTGINAHASDQCSIVLPSWVVGRNHLGNPG